MLNRNKISNFVDCKITSICSKPKYVNKPRPCMSVHAQADLIAALNVFFFIISVQYTVSYFKKHIQMCGIKKLGRFMVQCVVFNETNEEERE